jgi:hypothetical protein
VPTADDEVRELAGQDGLGLWAWTSESRAMAEFVLVIPIPMEEADTGR